LQKSPCRVQSRMLSSLLIVATPYKQVMSCTSQVLHVHVLQVLHNESSPAQVMSCMFCAFAAATAHKHTPARHLIPRCKKQVRGEGEGEQKRCSLLHLGFHFLSQSSESFMSFSRSCCSSFSETKRNLRDGDCRPTCRVAKTDRMH